MINEVRQYKFAQTFRATFVYDECNEPLILRGGVFYLNTVGEWERILAFDVQKDGSSNWHTVDFFHASSITDFRLFAAIIKVAHEIMGSLICSECSKGLNDGATLHRMNPLGVKGIWKCAECLNAFERKAIDPGVQDIVNIIEKSNEQRN